MFYVKGTKHLAADGLSRRPPQPGHGDGEGDVDDIIKMDLDYLGITPLIHDVEVKRAVHFNYHELVPKARSREGTDEQLPTRDLTTRVNATTASSLEESG
jgi:hypothetical protein